MTTEITLLDAPTIWLTGTRLFNDGTTNVVTDLLVNQTTPQGSPTEVTNTRVYMFRDQVEVAIVAPSGVTLFDYSGETEDDTHFISMLPETETEGNVLYFFGEKMPSPTEANVYIAPFRVVEATREPSSGFSGRTYKFPDDTIVCSACAFFNGKVGQVASIRIKIV